MLRKYFTRRCILLHLTVLIVVPVFLALGRWQYHSAESGNTLSWAYTFEWPAFAAYAVYVWWQLIHDQTPGLDRIRAAKERGAAAASGMSIEEVPGWALEKTLTRALTEASLEPFKPGILSRARRAASLESRSRNLERARTRGRELGDGTQPPTGSSGQERGICEDDLAPDDLEPGHQGIAADEVAAEQVAADEVAAEQVVDAQVAAEQVVDAQVVDVKVVVDEELEEYNRWLAQLNSDNVPKRW
ncbi:MAG: hypothetical protein ACYCV7_11075 [Acidimicrobiales bacterium]